MSPRLGKQQFEEAYAHRSNTTVRRLRELGRRVYPCSCDDPECEGWQSVNPVYYWEDKAFRASGFARWIAQLKSFAWIIFGARQ